MKQILHVVMILVILLGLPGAARQVWAQTDSDPLVQARAALSSMTPEERVGQLFLISFDGSEIRADDPIVKLIQKYYIGGVVLSEARNNFTGPEGTIEKAYALTSQLQNLSYETSLTVHYTSSSAAFFPTYVPLFIAISQEGDLSPYDQIINGLTPLPNEMAIGATWKTDLAKQVGSVMGKELSALGFNMLLGPSLDVLDVLHTEGSEDLGTRTFGGDPFWVSRMGTAYIEGLHTGSNNHLAVIAKHFPGRGSSDRAPEDEVATVRKTLAQMQQVELVPFFAATKGGVESLQTTDGLLVSHIRYQFQGNIRQVTRPVSFERTALDQLLALEPLATWRTSGGVVVSDDLGSQAVRKFYDPTLRTFDSRTVARNAFLAGNDLLYINNFLSTGDPDELTSITRTLESFAQKYREDDAFATQVDASVLRLLTLKYRLYPQFNLNEVVPEPAGLTQIGSSQAVTFEVARQAVTLISPAAADLSAILPRPPDYTERIVFLTDAMESQACTICQVQPILSLDALQNVVFRLYGPRAGGLVQQNRLSSYSFGELTRLLNQNAEVNPQLELDIEAADWIVFSTLGSSTNRPESQALKRFLTEKPDLYRNKKVIVMAFNAPYYLDATDISKVTAVYGLYSKSSAFVEIAARLLFQEIVPTGGLPVSVPGIGYDVSVATSPDPVQVISILLDLPVEAVPTPTPAAGTKPTLTPVPTPVPLFKVGDILPLRTGVILDHNHNLVPDGTVVRFVFTTGGAEGGTTQYVEAITTDGVARASFKIQIAGLLEIRVFSEPAERSEVLQLDVSAGQAAAITQIVPTEVATETPTPTLTISPTPTATPTVEPVSAGNGRLGGWLLSILAILVVAGVAYWIGIRRISIRWGVRWSLLAVCGGFAAYIYIVIGLPGGSRIIETSGVKGITLTALLGAVLGWLGGCIWQLWLRNRARAVANRRINEPK